MICPMKKYPVEQYEEIHQQEVSGFVLLNFLCRSTRGIISKVEHILEVNVIVAIIFTPPYKLSFEPHEDKLDFCWKLNLSVIRTFPFKPFQILIHFKALTFLKVEPFCKLNLSAS